MSERINPGLVAIRIISMYGSDGMPCCGLTDAGKIGQGIQMTFYAHRVSGYEILPGTPINNLPINLQHKYTPGRMKKSPRNMKNWLQSHKK